MYAEIHFWGYREIEGYKVDRECKSVKKESIFFGLGCCVVLGFVFRWIGEFFIVFFKFYD